MKVERKVPVTAHSRCARQPHGLRPGAQGRRPAVPGPLRRGGAGTVEAATMPAGGSCCIRALGLGLGMSPGPPSTPPALTAQTWSPGERRRAESDPWWSLAELQAWGTWRPRLLWESPGRPGLLRQEPPWAAALYCGWWSFVAPKQGFSSREEVASFLHEMRLNPTGAWTS